MRGGDQGIGGHALLDLIVHAFPSPLDRGDVGGTDLKAKQAGTRGPDPKASVSALVFKTLSDPHIGKLTLFRVYSGTLRADSTLLNPGRGAKERMGHVSWLQGKTQKNVEALGPGEIGVAQKLKETLTGDTLTDEAQPFELPKITFPEPAINFAIQPKSRGDEDKISLALARIAEEDPTVHHHFDPETKQLLISGVGQPPRRDDGGAHEAQVQRRRVAAAAAHSLQGDGQGARRGAGQVQEADGRPWTVRRHLATGGADVRGAVASSSSTISSAAPCPATSSRRWRRASATA